MLIVMMLNWLFLVVMLVVICWCRMFFFSVIYLIVWLVLVVKLLVRFCMWIMLLLFMVVMVIVLVCVVFVVIIVSVVVVCSVFLRYIWIFLYWMLWGDFNGNCYVVLIKILCVKRFNFFYVEFCMINLFLNRVIWCGFVLFLIVCSKVLMVLLEIVL